LQEARDRRHAERQRQLYVAVTRAESWLVIAAAEEARAQSASGWHGQALEALAGLAPRREGHGLVGEEDWPAPAAALRPEPLPPAPPVPAWLTEPAAPPPARPRQRSPSDLGGEIVLPGEPGAGDPMARHRGRWLHAMLDLLPRRNPADWEASGAAALAGDENPPPAEEAERVTAAAAALLTAPHLARLFAPGTLSEVAFTLPLDGMVLTGRFDRIIPGPDHIRVIDYKSNRRVPADSARVPEGILRQLGAYAAAARAIWPGRRVSTEILWTASGTLMEVPQDMVDAAFARREMS
jgi:ATP-dependent helicase/nuclease subunit A